MPKSKNAFVKAALAEGRRAGDPDADCSGILADADELYWVTWACVLGRLILKCLEFLSARQLIETAPALYLPRGGANAL